MLSRSDRLGTIGARTGFGRTKYTVTPGLYCVGRPSDESPVLVTANYKLSFDALRKELQTISCWILVVDTRGINVWCSGGKGTFSAEEIAYQVKNAHLDQLISHRELILPQLAANGIAARKLKKLCGFRGRFGPVLASRLPEFLETGTCSEDMRTVTFTLKERAALIPVEVCMLWKTLFALVLVFFVASGISPALFSLQAAAFGALTLMAATFAAIFVGAVITPLLLPWIPFRQFWLKGAVLGALSALPLLFVQVDALGVVEKSALVLWISGCSSYLAMNFTGSTPFTSLSGVAKEMRKGLGFQIISVVLALILWLSRPFLA